MGEVTRTLGGEGGSKSFERKFLEASTYYVKWVNKSGRGPTLTVTADGEMIKSYRMPDHGSGGMKGKKSAKIVKVELNNLRYEVEVTIGEGPI